jgi:hypothetical protein
VTIAGCIFAVGSGWMVGVALNDLVARLLANGFRRLDKNGMPKGSHDLADGYRAAVLYTRTWATGRVAQSTWLQFPESLTANEDGPMVVRQDRIVDRAKSPGRVQDALPSAVLSALNRFGVWATKEETVESVASLLEPMTALVKAA